jgi:hypothetical protein
VKNGERRKTLLPANCIVTTTTKPITDARKPIAGTAVLPLEGRFAKR